MANADCINIVVGAPPEPDYILVDKVIARAVRGGVEVYVTVNKCDISRGALAYVQANYRRAVNEIFAVSAVTGEGVGEMLKRFSGKLCAFTGQSAVGKTSLINRIFGENARVGALSEKLQRGRHTTTSSEIRLSGELAVADTPGFSEYMVGVKPEELALYYPEFTSLESECYYKGCVHSSEPNCAVKIAVENGLISKDRYLRYLQIYKNLVEEFRYDKR